GGQRLLLEDAPPDHRVDLGILGFHRRHAAIEHRNLPVAPRARALAADDELARLPALVGGVRDDRGHDGADEADAHDDHYLLAVGLSRRRELLEPRELARVLVLLGQGESFTGGVDGVVWHGRAPLVSTRLLPARGRAPACLLNPSRPRRPR